MPTNAGGVSVKIRLDDKDAVTELRRLMAKIQAMKAEVEARTAERNDLKSRYEKAAAAVEETKNNIALLKAELKESPNPTHFYETNIKLQEAEALLKEQTKTAADLKKEYEASDKALGKSTGKLRVMENEASILEEQIKAANAPINQLSRGAGNAIKGIKKGFEWLGNRVTKVFFFRLAYRAIDGLRKHLEKMLLTVPEIRGELAELKGAAMTAFQPLLETAIPLLVAGLRQATDIMRGLANVTASLFGTTTSEASRSAKAMNDEAEGLNATGEAAKEAKRQLAGFDTLNVLSDKSSKSGSNSQVGAEFEGIQRDLNATDLLRGEIAVAFGCILLFSGASPGIGLAMIAAGAATMYKAASTNWDGIKNELQGKMRAVTAIVSAATLAVGAILTFFVPGATATAIGIGMMLAGAAGLGLTAASNWNYIVSIMQGKVGVITAIVSAALLVLGAIFTFFVPGAQGIGIGLLLAGAAGLATTAAFNWDYVKEKVQRIIALLKIILSAALFVLGVVLLLLGALPIGLALMAAGAKATDTAITANESLLPDTVKRVWAKIKTWYQANVAPIFTVDWWKEKFESISEGLKARVKDGVNGAIALLNRFVNWLNDTFAFSWDPITVAGVEIVPGGYMQLFKLPEIPYLAQGAVIPPNREFMAVLGDQTSGTNIEAPLDTIVEAVKTAMGGIGGHEVVTAILSGVEQIKQEIRKKDTGVYLDGRELARGLYRPMQEMKRTIGGSMVNLG